jgi:hypothetical protein
LQFPIIRQPKTIRFLQAIQTSMIRATRGSVRAASVRAWIASGISGGDFPQRRGVARPQEHSMNPRPPRQGIFFWQHGATNKPDSTGAE